VAPLPRRPGERGQRYTHLLGGEAAVQQPVEGPRAPMPEPTVPAADGGLGERLDRLEAEVAALRAELHGLRDRLDS
jgi:uncharacterized protein YceH (UPF0502 family)